MNKQKLIDKAVEQFKGVWPKFDWDESTNYKHAIVQTIKEWTDEDENITYQVGDIQRGGTKFNKDYTRLVCLKHEFTTRARELGWINSYKYGAEYPTNGKKPDLPDDVVVDVFYEGYWHCSGQVNKYDFTLLGQSDDITKFRIVDERYKPYEVAPARLMHDGENNQVFKADMTDNSWHGRGELPPNDSECEYSDSDFSGWRRCKYIGINTHGSKKYAVLYDSVKKEYVNPKICAELKFRPIKTEREKFVEAACKVKIEIGFASLFDAMYDAGFRAPE